ncbi:cupin domain-containing protein [Paraburkholderia phenazinium]|uniref:Transcriptional regulator, AraC family n=1 Tax=Paraburkholderia phenazinium TaxID=60549 RepID=A0A1G8AP65_9BURK|nr:AraC family transcriptional regulator [Paraburkholderia phenazinium]SDH22765.1 transcriptional regulator, AraC family [Paraburkholderia phenazinium]
MDLLSRLLALMPVAGRLDVRCHFGAPWRIDEPAADAREIPYHVLLRGEAVIEDGHGEPLRMTAGDIVLFPAGAPHALHDGSSGAVTAASARQVDGLTVATNEGTGAAVDILCGRFLLPAVPERLLRDHLPGRLLVHSVAPGDDVDAAQRDGEFANSRLARLIQLMREEALEQGPASETLVNHLSGALFALTLRFASHADEPPRGLLALAQRPRLQPAVAAMFDEPGKPWTLPELAELCHMSRATFARHFDEAIGRSASDVLTEIRMALAGRKLAQTSLGIAEIGEAVGYQSDAAFQRVFKRQVGMTPAQWRALAKAESVLER